MTKYILFGAVAALIIGFIVYTAIRNNKIRKNGVEADAVITRIEEQESVDSEGGVDYTYTHYVAYQSPDGQTVEPSWTTPPGAPAWAIRCASNTCPKSRNSPLS